jgi:hypothetical protein
MDNLQRNLPFAIQSLRESVPNARAIICIPFGISIKPINKDVIE